MSSRPWLTGVLSGVAGLGCADLYMPRRVDDRIAITGSHYVKSGQRYPRNVWRSALGMITADDPQAHAWAHAARTKQYVALAADVLAVVTGIVGVVAAARSKDNLNDVEAQIYLNASLILAVVGPVIHVRSNEQELDAINRYNDARRQREEARPGVGGVTAHGAVSRSWWPPLVRREVSLDLLLDRPAAPAAPCRHGL